MAKVYLRNGKYALIDDEDLELLDGYRWRCTTLGYAVSTISKTSKVIWMHRLVNDTPGGYETDHINQNKLDNRKSNLRTATHGENNRNRLNGRNTSGYKGISWHKGASKWTVQIYAGKRIYLGIFSDLEEAREVYKQAAEKYHGEYATY